MRRQDFSFDLPAEQIAQVPAERGESRLLVVQENGVEHASVGELGEWLAPGDLLVVNDTRVIKARLAATKDSGGSAEILIERLEDAHTALAQVRASKALKAGRELFVANIPLRVVGREDNFYRLACSEQTFEALLDAHGSVPLPPYIEREARTEDESRYQTVYADRPGAVAAPTAGLHFTDAMLDALQTAGVSIASVTLHVGAGTFSPIRTDDLDSHVMHTERFELSADCVQAIEDCRARGGRVVAVGTTVVRVLETVALEGELAPCAGETALFIRPGFPYRVVDALMTNFHLPESTLLMLVCAFAGQERILAAYREAVAKGYRFFSYGDAMLCFNERRSAGEQYEI
ncbi:MAG: tRNA preQ1(34) S-adenosylmethionine ribosyltransferase-isomerase QueA [Pseudomonadaceae bacterium]|nr:tRNA preQ1(34) S-adenosylmethionine ribosyltransferase-isomerase QueA [Pseudomonadaceae bacterium]